MLILASYIIVAAPLAGTISHAAALSAADWNAGNIISDLQFFNSSGMSVDDIQNFLNSAVPVCDTWGTQPHGSTTRAAYGTSVGYPPPYTCLRDYYENPTTHQNNANGGSVTGGASAAQIIKSVADTYGINPKVLIVLLQKESSLVTDDWPWTNQYRSATGYGCPDTAPCDAQYYGFYNQVMNAAAQFKRYATNTTSYRYQPFQSNFILYNPSSSCGGTNVYLQNQATAGLYDYTPYQPNGNALANLYGSSTDPCSSYGNRNFWRLYNDWFGSTQSSPTLLNFKSQLSGTGWTGSTINSGVTGTTGQKRPMEGFKITGEVEYSSYNYATGWQPTVNQGMISGTVGQAKPIQAIKVNPLGSLAANYDVYYRAHVSNIGWMDWAKNGQVAGVTGDSSKDIEAFQIYIAPKGFSAPGTAVAPYQNAGLATYTPALSLSVTSQVQDYGWQPTVTDGMTTGTTEQGKRLEALKAQIGNNSTGLTGSVVYSAYVQDIGWQGFMSDGAVAGTIGQAKRMEAIRLNLTGQLGASYDIWYRTYVQDIGWMDWAKNGQPAGSMGAGKRLEAVETRLVSKNSTSLPNQNPLYNPTNASLPDSYIINYGAQVSQLGWINNLMQNSVGGTTGQSKTLETLQFNNGNSLSGPIAINCSAYVTGTGWMNDVTPGNLCGTVGQARPLQAVKLYLTGDSANNYDVYYRVHLSYLGWQNWVMDGAQAGNQSSTNPVEAVMIKLVQK